MGSSWSEGQLDEEGGAFAWRAHDGDRAAVLLDDPVRDGQAQARAFPDFLGGEERIEDPPLEPGWNPLTGIGQGDFHGPGGDRRRNVNQFAWRLGYRVTRVGQ